MVPLKDRNREELDKAHINIAKRLQGLQSNMPAMVSLVTLIWERLTTYIDKEAMKFWENNVLTNRVCL